MTRRARTILVILALTALGGAAAVTVAVRSGAGGSDAGPAAEVEEVPQFGVTSPRPSFKGAARPPAPARDFAVHDQDGGLVTLKQQRGKVVILSPMYTTCRESCPVVAQQISAAIEDLTPDERKRVVALALSVDPANDTPESAKHFLRSRHVGGYLDFLLGSRSELRPIWKAYGFAPQTKELEHNSYVVVIDRAGRQRVGFPQSYLTPEALAHDLRLLLHEPD